MQVANEHISMETIERYARRISAPAETLELQRHVAICEMCREKLTKVADSEKAFSALKNDFAFENFTDEPEHLPYEQLALFADGKLDAVDREIAESHFAICPECEKDLADLRLFQQIAAAPPIQATDRKRFWKRLFAFDFLGSLVPAVSAAIILFAVLAGAWFLIRFNQNNGDELAQTNVNKNLASPVASLSPVSNGTSQDNNASNINSATNSNFNSTLNVEANQPPKQQSEKIPNTSPELALNDGHLFIDEEGNVRGLENLSPAAQRAVRQSLQTEKVSVSISANSLGGNNGVLMGGGNETGGVPFALVSPIGKVIRENQPVLRWKPLKDANGYTAAIVDDKFRVIEESGKLNSTEWKPTKPLPRGANYSWQVTATKADGTETVSPAPPAPQARFRVLEQTALDDLNKLEKQTAKSNLALGVLYAHSGLIDEARREFEILARENPHSTLARKLLASVKGKAK